MISTKLTTCRRGPLVRPARSSAATSGRGGVREIGHGGGVGEHRGVARALAHLVGQVGGAGKAGARLRAGTGCGARGGHLRGSAAPSWHWERDGMLGLGGGGPRRRRRHGRRREASAVVGSGATAWIRGGEERGTVEELTADPASARTRSGMPGSSRIDGEYPRRPEARMATAMAPRDAPSCLARRGGRGGRGGARGLYGGARGRRGARRR